MTFLICYCLNSLGIWFLYLSIGEFRRQWRRSAKTLQWRLCHQDYAVTFCKMSLTNEVTRNTVYIVEVVGLKFGDGMTLRVAGPRPPIGFPFHLAIDQSIPKRIYWFAELENQRFDDEYDGEPEIKLPED